MQQRNVCLCCLLRTAYYGLMRSHPPGWRSTRDLLSSLDVIRLRLAPGQLPVDAQRISGALLPGERSSDLDGTPAKTVPPVVVFDDALHSLAPTVDVEWF